MLHVRYLIDENHGFKKDEQVGLVKNKCMLTSTTTAMSKIDELQVIPDGLPCFFLLIPFEPGMNNQAEFEIILNTAARKAEMELMQKYSASQLEPVVKRLHSLIKRMTYKSDNKSIAIIVSPLVEKVYYFNYTTELLNRF